MEIQKEALCEAFCGELTIREVPAGLAISTGFTGIDGEPLGFYIVGPNEKGQYRIEDDGLTIPYLEAEGADIKNNTRREAFYSLLQSYGADFNEETGEIVANEIIKNSLPAAAIRFVALLLRVQDLLLMAAERAASTFHDDVVRALHTTIGDRAKIELNTPISQQLSDFPADILITAPKRNPVALFLGNSESKVYEAMMVNMEAELKFKLACSIVVLIETEKSISHKMRQKASNRVNFVTSYRGDEDAAISRIAKEAFGTNIVLH